MTDEMKYIRRTIDQLDQEIVTLLTQRFQAAYRIGEIKREAGIEILDGKREQEILDRLAENLEDESMRSHLIRIYETIFKESREYQLTKRT